MSGISSLFHLSMWIESLEFDPASALVKRQSTPLCILKAIKNRANGGVALAAPATGWVKSGNRRGDIYGARYPHGIRYPHGAR